MFERGKREWKTYSKSGHGDGEVERLAVAAVQVGEGGFVAGKLREGVFTLALVGDLDDRGHGADGGRGGRSDGSHC